MPRAFGDYTWSDWRRLRPLTHAFKSWRYGVVDRMHMRRPPRAGDLTSLIDAIRGRDVLVTIAYRDPQVTAWQAPLIRHYLPQALHVIADNTPDEQEADAIKAHAERAGAHYLRLPRNPWHSGSRSHGIAMNWMWRNVLRPGEPRYFGFLDHDLFPTTRDDPFPLLGRQPFHGYLRHAGDRWFLWAGYCFFRFDVVRSLPLDFGQDWFIGLDTGGANWNVLYRHTAIADFEFTKMKTVPFELPNGVGTRLQWCGTWLHEIGWIWRGTDCDTDKRAAVASALAPHLVAAARSSAAAASARAAADRPLENRRASA